MKKEITTSTSLLGQHNSRVKTVSEQVKGFYKEKKQFRIYRGGTHSTRSFMFKRGEVVDVTELEHVIEINVNEQWALVEPNVSMRELVRVSLQNGLIPPVVMEFPEITVGGAIQGGAGESSSFKQGLFHDICMEYQLILGNGDVLTVSKDHNPELYFASAGSYGSLAVMTLIKLRLVPAKKFVELKYTRTNNFQETINTLERIRLENVDFLDGIIFSKNKGVVMTGMFTDNQTYPIVTFSKSKDEWFYLHSEDIVKRQKEYIEVIPLTEYLFRYDRGAFWMGSFSFNVFKVPFNKLTRCLFNIFLNTKTLYRSLHAAGFAQQYIIQDFCLPTENALQFLNFCDDKMAVYPIWLCPLKTEKNSKLSLNYLNSSTAMNVGLYGLPTDVRDLRVLNEILETCVKDLGGRKWLYSEAYYKQDEFWSIYDQNWYMDIRKKYYADTVFPDIYNKVHVKEKTRGSVIKGFFNFFLSPFRLHS